MVSAAGAGGPEAAERLQEERRWMHEELACMMPSGARHLLVFHAAGGEATARLLGKSFKWKKFSKKVF